MRWIAMSLVLSGCLPEYPTDTSNAQGTMPANSPGADLASAPAPADLGSATPSPDLATSNSPSPDLATSNSPPPDLASNNPPPDLASNNPPPDLAGAPPPDLASNCIPLTTALTSGQHNPGTACLNCHSAAGGATPWSTAGTLYNAVSGGTAVAGATVEIVDANNQVVRIVTSTNGNFYTATALAFPLKVRASGCPSDLPMNGAVSNGDCNSCHNSTFRVHLP